MLKAIFIEDDEKKIEDVLKVLTENFRGLVSINTKKSYQSGLREVLKNNYDLILLDMSLPTWEEINHSSQGSFEKFGGYKILSELKRKNKELPTILITMFDDFGQLENPLTLNQLDETLEKDFEKNYKGHVFYNSRESKWKKDLINKFKEILDEGSSS